MRLKRFEKTRKAATTVAVAALVAAVSYAVSGQITGHTPAFALSASEDFSITSQVYASTCSATAGAKLSPNVSRCLAVTVHNPLTGVALEVTSLSMATTAFVATPANTHKTPKCTPTMLSTPTSLTHTFTVAAGTTHTIDAHIELETRPVTQDNCENGTFDFAFSGSATYTDTTMTSLSAHLTGSTGILSATVIPANPSVDPHGPSGAPVHHVTFYSCGTTASCSAKTVLATRTLTTEGTATKKGGATYHVPGLTSAGTYYFEVSYPATASRTGTFAKSTSPIESITVSSSGGSVGGGTPAITTPTLPPAGLPPGITVIGGKTADTTAALEFTRVFPYAKGVCPTSRAAVVATTKVFQDALSSQYLAQDLTTGTLLTPTETLAPVTAAMLEKEGVQTVYIVGGPLAVDTTVAQEIADLTAYECGGTTRTPTTGKIVVHRIWGKTQYGTAKAVAEFVGPGTSLSFAGAYATSNATGGTGKFNDTGGKGTSAPGGAEPTAILASGEEFQDAQAASVISYRTKVPLLLTAPTSLVTTAIGAIKKLGITQVILMGGTMAVTNAVEATLVAKTGVSVLRIAGKDYTDTAAELARFEAAGKTEGLAWTPDHRVLVARGNGFTDGIAGAVLENVHNTATGTAGAGRPLLLTENPTALGTYLTTFLKVTGHTGIDKVKGKTVTDLTILGGPLAVSTTEMAAMQTDLAH